MAGILIASIIHYGSFASQYRNTSLLITGKKQKKLDNLSSSKKLISMIIALLSRINSRAMVNFHKEGVAFSLAKLGKHNRRIRNISGKASVFQSCLIPINITRNG